MSHQVHPKSFRLERIEDWHSRGFYGKKAKEKLQEDFRIRKVIKEKLDRTNIEKIEIDRFPASVKVIIFTSRPGLVIGRKGERISSLQALVKKEVSGGIIVKTEVKPVKKIWTSAQLSAEWMASQIKKRIAYRRVLRQALANIMRNKEVKGAKVQIAGRLNGNEMSRTEWMKEGELKRQTLRSDLDYGFSEAYCTYGVIGIKVWIYKGEKLE